MNQFQSHGYDSTELYTVEKQGRLNISAPPRLPVQHPINTTASKKGIHATSLNGLHMTREQRSFLMLCAPQLSGNIAPHRKAVELVRRHAFSFGRPLGLVGQPDTREGIQGSIRPVARDPLQVIEGRVHHDAAALQRRQNVVTLLQCGQDGDQECKNIGKQRDE